jgi:membrane protein
VRLSWQGTALTLRDRFRKTGWPDQQPDLPRRSLVPFTVALAVFTLSRCCDIPGALQDWLVRSLIPDNIARQVLGYLTQFSNQANKLRCWDLRLCWSPALA